MTDLTREQIERKIKHIEEGNAFVETYEDQLELCRLALQAPQFQPAPKGHTQMTEAQIKHMTDRFLNWRLPKEFHPDNGVTFTPYGHQTDEHFGYQHWPVGTNLFDAMQAAEMVRHMVDGLPIAQPAPQSDVVVEKADKIEVRGVTEKNLGLDEIVSENCSVHLERMDDDKFWMAFSAVGVSVNVNLFVKKGKIYASVDHAIFNEEDAIEAITRLGVKGE